MSTQDSLELITADLEVASATLPLAKSAVDIVPGEGSATAKIMLIGEAPGFEEARQKRPFVGRSGQLLRKTLQENELHPEELYISNIVKARPPENRDPLPVEIAAYKPFLDREIDILQPKLIITLGRFSMAKFLPLVKISQVHGRLHRVKWRNRVLFILPMYHPAAALRATQVKKYFLDDFAKVKKIMIWIDKQQDTITLQSDIENCLL